MHVRCRRSRTFLPAVPLHSGRSTNRHLSQLLTESLLNDTQKSAFQRSGERLSFDGLTSLIKQCSDEKDLQRGILLHKFMRRSKVAHNTLLGNLLIQMYGSCGCLKEAKEVFRSIPRLSTHSWNIYIKACVKCGSASDAMDAFAQMLQKGLDLLALTILCVLDACSCLEALDLGCLLHSLAVELGYEGDVMVGTALFKMYGKFKLLNEARSVFNSTSQRDVIAWSSMIALCTHNNCEREAWELYRQMQHTCIVPDQVAYLNVLDVCAYLGSSVQGQQVHISILEAGFDGDMAVGTSLVNMYGKCAKFDEASSAFHRISRKSLVTWNTMVTACVVSERSREALAALIRMQLEGFIPDQGTYVLVLTACSRLGSIKDGCRIHSLVNTSTAYSKEGVVLGTALSNMYGKCGHLDNAIKVFNITREKDVISWCGIMTACTENGHDDDALTFFRQMQVAGLDPDEAVFVCALDVCGKVVDLDKGRELHMAIAITSLERDTTVGTALIDMYGKCGSIHDAKAVFKRMHSCNIVTWSAMIAVYAHSGHSKKAISLFQEMPYHDMVPNDITFRSLLTACSHTGQVNDGVHYFVNLCQEKGLMETEEHRMSMIDLLGRAGHLDVAENLIEGVSAQKKALALSCLLGACKVHGDVERGERIASDIYRLDPENAASLVTLLHIYSGANKSRCT